MSAAIIKQLKRDLKTMASFRCVRPKTCGNGAVCNSCWASRWAKRQLNGLKDAK